MGRAEPLWEHSDVDEEREPSYAPVRGDLALQCKDRDAHRGTAEIFTPYFSESNTYSFLSAFWAAVLLLARHLTFFLIL